MAGHVVRARITLSDDLRNQLACRVVSEQSELYYMAEQLGLAATP